MRRLALALTLAGLLAGAGNAAALAPFGQDHTLLVSAAPGLDDPLTIPADDSDHAILSGDGQHVVFSSAADGLASTDDDTVTNVYVKDLTTGAIRVVNTGNTGQVDHDGSSVAGISDDGTFVAFLSKAGLTGAGASGHRQMYVRDFGDQTTKLVSFGAGNVAADQDVNQGTISGNGARVAFATAATNLGVNPGGFSQIYRQTADPSLVLADPLLLSRATTAGGAIGNGHSLNPSLSNDANKAAFDSYASNLQATDANGVSDVFVRDVTADTTTGLTKGNAGSYLPGISGDGTSVAFISEASDLGSTQTDGDGQPDVFWRPSNASSAPTIVNLINASATTKGNGDVDPYYAPSLSTDGARVSWGDASTNLVAGDANGQQDVFLRVIGSMSTILLSRADGDAGAQGDPFADQSTIDESGTHATFHSIAGLTGDGMHDVGKIFLRTIVSPAHTTLVSRPPGSDPFINLGGEFYSEGESLSADGRVAVFSSNADGLSGDDDDTTTPFNAYARDIVTGAVTLVGRADGAGGALAKFGSTAVGVSADGTRVLFTSQADNLGVANPSHAALGYVRDLVANTTTFVTPAANGGVPNNFLAHLALSADGKHVVFESLATNLVADDTHGKYQVYVRDVAEGATALVSRDGAGAVGTESSSGARVNGDGSRVAFGSHAALDGPAPAVETHTYIRDRTAATTKRLDADGTFGVPEAISSSGARVLIQTNGHFSPADPPADAQYDLYVADLAAGTMILADRNTDGAKADSEGSVPLMSDDGNAVAYETLATNLGPSNGDMQLFVTRLDDGSTTLASRSDGAAGALPTATGSPYPQRPAGISADGGCVAFQTTEAADPGPLVTTWPAPQIWMRAVRGACPTPAPAPVVTPAPVATPTPTTPARDTTRPKISKFSLSARRFKVAKGATAISAIAKGTKIRFTLSEKATVRITIQRLRRVKRKTKVKTVGTLTRKNLAARANTVKFSGRIGKKPLARGKYLVILRAVDAAGNVSAKPSLPFTIV